MLLAGRRISRHRAASRRVCVLLRRNQRRRGMTRSVGRPTGSSRSKITSASCGASFICEKRSASSSWRYFRCRGGRRAWRCSRHRQRRSGRLIARVSAGRIRAAIRASSTMAATRRAGARSGLRAGRRVWRVGGGGGLTADFGILARRRDVAFGDAVGCGLRRAPAAGVIGAVVCMPALSASGRSDPAGAGFVGASSATLNSIARRTGMRDDALFLIDPAVAVASPSALLRALSSVSPAAPARASLRKSIAARHRAHHHPDEQTEEREEQHDADPRPERGTRLLEAGVLCRRSPRLVNDTERFDETRVAHREERRLVPTMRRKTNTSVAPIPMSGRKSTDAEVHAVAMQLRQDDDVDVEQLHEEDPAGDHAEPLHVLLRRAQQQQRERHEEAADHQQQAEQVPRLRCFAG